MTTIKCTRVIQELTVQDGTVYAEGQPMHVVCPFVPEVAAQLVRDLRHKYGLDLQPALSLGEPPATSTEAQQTETRTVNLEDQLA